VSRAVVRVEDQQVGAIGVGLVALVGVATGDGPADVEYIASKIAEVRIFPDDSGKMNRSVAEAGGSLLVISQFTVLGDVRNGRRPAFDGAEAPAAAQETYDALIERLGRTGLSVETGRFRAHMALELVNDGPVTILLDSRRGF